MKKEIMVTLVILLVGAVINAFVASAVVYGLNGIHVAGIETYSFWKGTFFFIIVLSSVAVINLLLLLVRNGIVYLALTVCTTPLVMMTIAMQGIEFHWAFSLVFGLIISARYFNFWWKTYLKLVEKMPKSVIEILS